MSVSEIQKLQRDSLFYAVKKQDAIFDVGSSTAKKFLDLMEDAGFFEKIDAIVIPVLNDEKVIDDTDKFVRYLLNILNIPKEKIFLIINKTKTNEDIINIKKKIADTYKISNLLSLPEFPVAKYLENEGMLSKDFIDKNADKDFLALAEEEASKDNPDEKLIREYLDKHLAQIKFKTMSDKLFETYIDISDIVKKQKEESKSGE